MPIKFILTVLCSLIFIIPTQASIPNPIIKIALVEHFGHPDVEESIQASSTKSNDSLLIYYPSNDDAETVDLSTPQETRKKIKISTYDTELSALQKTYNSFFAERTLIIDNYRNFEQSLKAKQELQPSIKDTNIDIVYARPWQLQITSNSSNIKSLSKTLSESGYSPTIKDLPLSNKYIQWHTAQEQTQSKRIVIKSKNNLPIKINDNIYPGYIEIAPDSQGTFSVINIVNIEDYLRGVVPFEIGPDAGMSALETQAILARTYALANTHRYLTEEFDLCATVYCQVYRGLSRTNDRIDQAIHNTKNLILRNPEGNLAEIFYYSSDGGHSASIDEIWGDLGENFRYLKGVPTCQNFPKHLNLYEESDAKTFLTNPKSFWKCFDNTSRNRRFRWNKSFTYTSLANTLKKSQEKFKFNFPEFESITDIRIKRRSPSGRVIELSIKTNTGDFSIFKDEIRAALGGLRSTFFTIRHSHDTIHIKGAGFGHGIGLSQYGARKLSSDYGYTSKQILKTYFPYYSIEKL